MQHDCRTVYSVDPLYEANIRNSLSVEHYTYLYKSNVFALLLSLINTLLTVAMQLLGFSCQIKTYHYTILQCF